MHLGKVRSKAAESQVITNMTTKMTKMTKMQIAKAFVGTCCRSPELTTVSPPLLPLAKNSIVEIIIVMMIILSILMIISFIQRGEHFCIPGVSFQK